MMTTMNPPRPVLARPAMTFVGILALSFLTIWQTSKILKHYESNQRNARLDLTLPSSITAAASSSWKNISSHLRAVGHKDAKEQQDKHEEEEEEEPEKHVAFDFKIDSFHCTNSMHLDITKFHCGKKGSHEGDSVCEGGESALFRADVNLLNTSSAAATAVAEHPVKLSLCVFDLQFVKVGCFTVSEDKKLCDLLPLKSKTRGLKCPDIGNYTLSIREDLPSTFEGIISHIGFFNGFTITARAIIQDFTTCTGKFKYLAHGR